MYREDNRYRAGYEITHRPAGGTSIVIRTGGRDRCAEQIFDPAGARQFAADILAAANEVEPLTAPHATTPMARSSASNRNAPLGPQAKQILKHLQYAGNISGVEAFAMFKSRSLTKRIAELRAAGHKITSVWKHDTQGQRYVRYVLAEPNQRVAA